MSNQVNEAHEVLEQLIGKKNRLLRKIVESRKKSLKINDKKDQELVTQKKIIQQIMQIDKKIEYFSNSTFEFKDEEKIVFLLKKQEMLLSKLAKKQTISSNKKRGSVKKRLIQEKAKKYK